MKIYSDWESLVSGAQDACHTILDTDVAPIARDIVKKHIKTDIYDAYSPKPNAWVNGTTYQRRNLLTSSVYHKFIKDDEILITSDAPASKSVVKGYSFRNRRSGAFLSLLESGNMGIWRRGFPRPAIKNSQQEINTSDKVDKAIQRGLRREFQQK